MDNMFMSSKDYLNENPTTNKLTFEELTECHDKLFDYEECMVFEEGEELYCKFEKYNFQLCEWEKDLNLRIFKWNNLSTENYYKTKDVRI